MSAIYVVPVDYHEGGVCTGTIACMGSYQRVKTAEIVLARDIVAPGANLDGRVVIRCDKPFNCKGVALRFFGKERTVVSRGSGKQRRVYVEERMHINESVELSGPQEIPAGETSFDFSLLLPSNTPGTYEGTHGSITYGLEAEAEIAWSPNLECSKLVWVTWAAPPVSAQQRMEAISLAGVPVVRIELESDLIEPGLSIVVRFMVSPDVKCRGLRLQIRDYEMVAPHGVHGTAERIVAEAYYRIEDLHPGLWSQHVFITDWRFCPSFRSELIDFTHNLKATLDIAMGSDAEVSLPFRSAAYYREINQESA